MLASATTRIRGTLLRAGGGNFGLDVLGGKRRPCGGEVVHHGEQFAHPPGARFFLAGAQNVHEIGDLSQPLRRQRLELFQRVFGGFAHGLPQGMTRNAAARAPVLPPIFQAGLMVRAPPPPAIVPAGTTISLLLLAGIITLVGICPAK